MKRILAIFSIFLMLPIIAGCGAKPDSPSETTTGSQPASTESVPSDTEPSESDAEISWAPNPIVESTAADIEEKLGITFSLPDDSEDTVYTIINTDNASIAQVTFTVDHVPVTYRIMPDADSLSDISGMFFSWSNTAGCTINGCDGSLSYNSGEEGIINWYDASKELLCSISVDAGGTEEFLIELAEGVSAPKA